MKTYADFTHCVDRVYLPFASKKSESTMLSTITLAETFAILHVAGELDDPRSHSARRTVSTSLANKDITMHIFRTLAGHRRIVKATAFLYRRTDQFRSVIELV